MENAKVEKLKCDIFDDFQTLWIRFLEIEIVRGTGTKKLQSLKETEDF